MLNNVLKTGSVLKMVFSYGRLKKSLAYESNP